MSLFITRSDKMPITTTNTMIYGGAAGAVLFANEIAAVGGLVIAAIGLLVSAYFQWRKDQRDKREHDLQCMALERCHDDQTTTSQASKQKGTP